MRHKQEIEEANPFAMSTGDLMAALLFVFVLLLAAAMLQLNRTNAKIEKVTQQYEETRKSIIIGLHDELTEEQLMDWGAEIIDSTLTIRFQKDEAFFSGGSHDIPEDFKRTLDNFFPQYLKVLRDYQDYIAEVRIEGHTSSDFGSLSQSAAFIANMALSQDRSRSVFKYCEMLTPEEDKKWVHERVTANGLSSSHVILNARGKEDIEKSRRVEFRIMPTSEASLKNISDILNNH